VTLRAYGERWLATQTFDETSHDVVERMLREDVPSSVELEVAAR
jgi:hypothetical protein